MQAPYKDKYKDAPDSAVITLKARGSIDESKIACKVETGRALAVAMEADPAPALAVSGHRARAPPLA